MDSAARARRLANIQNRVRQQKHRIREQRYARHVSRVAVVLRRLCGDAFLQPEVVGALRCCCASLAHVLRPGLSAWHHQLALTEFDQRCRHLLLPVVGPTLPRATGGGADAVSIGAASTSAPTAAGAAAATTTAHLLSNGLSTRGWARLPAFFPPGLLASARLEVLGPRATRLMRWEHPLNPGAVRDDKIIWLTQAHAFSPSSDVRGRGRRRGRAAAGGGSGGDDGGGGGGGANDNYDEGAGDETDEPEDEQPPPGRAYVPRLLQRVMRGVLRVRTAVASALRLQSDRVEFQLAQYNPPSLGYMRHFDADTPDDRRATIIVYLNDPEWSPDDGGQLRIWQPHPAAASATVDLNPAGNGDVVVFLSAGVAHQVRPVHSSEPRLALTAWCY